LRILNKTELEKADARLLKLKELLGNNPDKGRKIWANLDPDDMTYERVMEILEKFSKK
jgi:hypothetical protein